MFKTLHKQQKGFTLIEVLVVVGILAILLAITLIALNPAKHFADTRNTQRSSDVSAILNAIYQYQASNKGNLPAALISLTADQATALSNTGVNLCSTLVPAYIADLPLDPDTTYGTRDASTTCASTAYNTGYEITKSSGATARFTVTAPHAEGATVSVTR